MLAVAERFLIKLRLGSITRADATQVLMPLVTAIGQSASSGVRQKLETRIIKIGRAGLTISKHRYLVMINIAGDATTILCYAVDRFRLIVRCSAILEP